MRKVVMFNLMTVDGFFEGVNSDISWHNVDEEFNDFAIQQTGAADGLIFGRKTYELMASYWPTEAALNDDPTVAKIMNSVPKYVFSKTLDKVTWNNSTLLKGDAAEELIKLKQQPGSELYIFGSADLSALFTEKRLIDEYRLLINPILLGCGKRLFPESEHQVKLKLLHSRTFKNGNVLLTYGLDSE